MFTATGSSVDKLEANCTASLGVLRVDTPDVCDRMTPEDTCTLGQAALGRPYNGRPHNLDIQGAALDEDISFAAFQSELPIGINAEVTRNILARNSELQLRLLGTPTVSQGSQFRVMAASGSVSTLVNGKQFHIEIVDCLDEYDSCQNGGRCIKASDGVSNTDGKVDCRCTGGFLPDKDGRCTVPAVPLVVTCPCDLQLAAKSGVQEVAAPEQFWEVIESGVSGGSGGSTTVEIHRSDGQITSASTQYPFAVGSVVVVTVRATSGDGQQSSACQVTVGVLGVTSTMGVREEPIMHGDALPPISITLGPDGVVPGFEVTYTLDSPSVIASQVCRGQGAHGAGMIVSQLTAQRLLPPLTLTPVPHCLDLRRDLLSVTLRLPAKQRLSRPSKRAGSWASWSSQTLRARRWQCCTRL